MNKAEVTFTADASQLKRTLKEVKTGAQGVKDKFGPAATAASGMASAFGGMSGQGGAALGAVDNLANALIQGGPLAVAMSVATTAVVGLGTVFFSAKKKAAELNKALAESQTSALKIAKGALEKYGETLDVVAKSSKQASYFALLNAAATLKEKRAVVISSKQASEARAEYTKNYEHFKRVYSEHTADLMARQNLSKENRELLKRDQETIKTIMDLESQARLALDNEIKESKKKTSENTDAKKKNTTATRKQAEAWTSWADEVERANNALIDLSLAPLPMPPIVTVDTSERDKLEEQDRLAYQQHKAWQLEQDRLATSKRIEFERRAEAELAAYRQGLAQEAGAMALDMAMSQASLWGQLAAAQRAGDHERYAELEAEEDRMHAMMLISIAERASQEALAQGAVLFWRGVGELALGNAGAIGTIAAGSALLALGGGGMMGAAAATGYVNESSNSSASGSSSGSSAPRTSIGAASSGDGQTTIIYNINGPAFGVGQDDASRAVYAMGVRGARLEGRR